MRSWSVAAGVMLAGALFAWPRTSGIALCLLALLVLLAVLRAHWRCLQPPSAELLAEYKAAMETGTPLYLRVEQRGREIADRILASDCDHWRQFPRAIELLLDAAGFRGQVALGAWSVLRRLVERRALRVVRFTGGSSGGQCAVLMAVDGLKPWVQFVFAWRLLRNRLIGQQLSILALVRVLARGGLGEIVHATIECVYQQLSHKLLALPDGTVSMAVFAWPGRELLLTGQRSWEELRAGIWATGAIPGISCGMHVKWRGHYCWDGGFACLSDGLPTTAVSQRPVLVCRTGLFNESDCDSVGNLWSIWGPSEQLQERAIMFGQDELARMLEGEHSDIFQLATTDRKA